MEVRCRTFARRALAQSALGIAVAAFGCDAERGAPEPRRVPVSVPSSSAGAAPTSPQPDVSDTCAPGTSSRVRRLSQVEYHDAVRALVGVEPSLPAWSAPDPLVNGFDNNADALAISPGNFEDFALAAELTAASADPTALAACAPDEALDACASRFVASFAARAFGRVATPDEVAGLEQQYRLGAGIENHARGIRLVIETVLLSPKFLYRSEIGADTDERPLDRLLDASETANALSFALTGRRPDATLAARARTDPEFTSASVLREEAQRLVRTPEAERHLAAFVRGWLGLPDVREINKIPLLFPEFTPALKADLEHEVVLFLEHALGPGGGTLDALFGEPVGFANENLLGQIYAGDARGGAKLPTPVPGNFELVPFDPRLRRGVLSLAGWLAAHSPVHRSSPVDRGLMIRSRLFCQSLPPPPPGVVPAAPGPSDGLTTTRQKFEQHATDDACSGCHTLMDPIGFGFEMMDALGRYRTTEGGLPVDSRGSLVDTDVDGPFRGPGELSQKILASAEVRACAVRQLFRFVEGRDVVAADSCRLEPLVAFFSDGKHSLPELAVELATQRAFAVRSAE